MLSDSEFEAFYQQLSDCMERKKALLEQQAAAHAAAEKLAEWGRFVPAELRELKEQGWEIHIYRTDKKTMERHRKYLVALLLAFTNGFEIIRGHLRQMARPVKEVK